MQTDLTKVNLLTTSDKNDILVSGGVIKVSGLRDIRLADLISLDIRNQQDEVVQVMTIGGTTDPTITASTKYIVKVGNTRKRNEGAQDSFRTYAYTSPATLTGTAADDRQDVYDNLATLINNDTSADWSANAGSGGTSMTITDDADYYKNGRKGASSVFTPKNSDGTGFIQATHLEESTSAVYAFGVGADIAAKAPVIDPVTGNVIGSPDEELVFDDASGAVTGQDYTGFYFTSIVRANVMTGINGEVYIRHNQLLFVDNGAGTDTTNATGYAATLREAERLAYGFYANDPSSLVLMMEETSLLFDDDGVGAPSNGAGDENLALIEGQMLRYHCIGGTATDPVGSLGTVGFDMDRGTPTNNEGLELSADISALNTKEFTVGQTECSFRAEITIADVSGTDDFLVGFRKKEAYQAAVDDYDEMAAFNIGAGAAGRVNTETILNNAATTTTDTTLTDWADTETHTLEVRVDLDGNVTYLYDDAEPTTVAAFAFDADEVIIPFIHHLEAADLSGGVDISKWYSIPAIIRRTV
jgi:hypothetical protein